MTKNISTDAEIDTVRLTQQGGHPSSPSSGYESLYVISGSPHGGLYVKDSAGKQIGPFITGTSSVITPTEINPTTISGCILWYDMNQESFAEGDAIATLSDFSATNNDATQGTGALRPTARLNIANGKKGAFFDGADYLQLGSNVDLPNHYTILVVMSPGYKATYSPVFAYKQQGIYQNLGGGGATFTGRWGIFRTADESYGLVAGGKPQTVGLWGTSNLLYDLLHNQIRHKGANSNAYSAHATSYVGTDALGTGTQCHLGYIFEIIVFNNKIAESDLYALLEWLEYKWNGAIQF
jgi:hypothetical protein